MKKLRKCATSWESMRYENMMKNCKNWKNMREWAKSDKVWESLLKL